MIISKWFGLSERDIALISYKTDKKWSPGAIAGKIWFVTNSIFFFINSETIDFKLNGIKPFNQVACVSFYLLLLLYEI